MNHSDLCILLALPPDASKHAIRSRAARLATGRAEFGSSPAKRQTIGEALHLAPGHGDLAIVRVVESHLAPAFRAPLSRRGNLRTGVVDARVKMRSTALFATDPIK